MQCLLVVDDYEEPEQTSVIGYVGIIIIIQCLLVVDDYEEPEQTSVIGYVGGILNNAMLTSGG